MATQASIRRITTKQLYALPTQNYSVLEKAIIRKEKERRELEAANNRARQNLVSRAGQQRVPRPRREFPSWSLYPELHDRVVATFADRVSEYVSGAQDIEDISFHNVDERGDEHTETAVMGRFRCRNESCDIRGWSSKKIFTTVEIFQDHSYNAVVFNQRCKECNAIGQIDLDTDTYIDRVVRRLQIHFGYRVPVQRYTKTDIPHETDLCEGCRHGYCERGRL